MDTDTSQSQPILPILLSEYISNTRKSDDNTDVCEAFFTSDNFLIMKALSRGFHTLTPEEREKIEEYKKNQSR